MFTFWPALLCLLLGLSLCCSGLIPAMSILFVAGSYWISLLSGSHSIELYVLFCCVMLPIPVSAYTSGMLLDAVVHPGASVQPLAYGAMFFALALSATPDAMVSMIQAAQSVIEHQSFSGALVLALNLGNSVLLTASIAVSVLLIPIACVELLFFMFWQHKEKPMSIHIPVFRQLAVVFLLSLSLQLCIEFFYVELWPDPALSLSPYTHGWLGML